MTDPTPPHEAAPLEVVAAPSPASRFHAFEEISSLAVVFALSDLTVVYANPAARRDFGIGEAAGLAGRRLLDLLAPAWGPRVEAEILPQARDAGGWSGACEFRDLHGRVFVSRATFVLEREGPEATHLCLQADAVGAGAAITATSFTDQALLQALLDSLPEAVYFKDAASRFIRIGRSQAVKLGVADPELAIGRTDFDFFAEVHARAALEDERRILTTGEPLIGKEERESWCDGRAGWVSTTKLPLRDRSGTIIGTFGISHDITARKAAAAEQRQIEAKLQLNHKLESLGRLAAGVAHEINTPTQYITDNAHFLTDAFAKLQVVLAEYRAMRNGAAACLARQSAEGSVGSSAANCLAAMNSISRTEAEVEIDYLLTEIPRCLQQSLDGLARVAQIVRSLKEFAHPNLPEMTPSDLNRTIETAIAVSRHEWKYVADVVTELDRDLPPVPCVVDEFSQAMLNLIVNAAHAIEEAMATRHQTRGKITVRSRRDGADAVVEVEDTGTGLPDEVRSRMFEPFFTTKPAGKGTGQGLALVHTFIVNHHHGSIDVETALGQGTKFILRLPLRPAPPPPPAASG